MSRLVTTKRAVAKSWTTSHELNSPDGVKSPNSSREARRRVSRASSLGRTNRVNIRRTSSPAPRSSSLENSLFALVAIAPSTLPIASYAPCVSQPFDWLSQSCVKANSSKGRLPGWSTTSSRILFTKPGSNLHPTNRAGCSIASRSSSLERGSTLICPKSTTAPKSGMFNKLPK